MKKSLMWISCLMILAAMLTVSAVAASEVEDNNTADAATVIEVNTPVEGNLSSRNDADWYRFTVTEAGCFDVTLDHELLSSSSAYWEIRVYDETGVNFLDGNNAYFSVLGNKNGGTSTYGVAPGTYYIKIVDSSYSDVPYTLRVNFKATEYAEKEFNGNKDAATKIELNKEYRASLSTSGDQDWFAFTVTEPGYFNLEFTHEVFDNSSRYWEIRFYDETGVNFIDGNDSYFYVKGNGNCTTNTMGVKPGTYLIRIKKSDFCSYDYNIKVNFTVSTDCEIEFNGNKDSATEIELNKEYMASLSTNGDIDWYRFTITEQGYFNLEFTHEVFDSSSRYWEIRFYDETGVNFVDGYDSYFYAKGNGNCTTNTMGVGPGTYYIHIKKSEYSGMDYHFKVNFTASSDSEIEFNSNKDAATKIELNKEYLASISTSGDQDWFVFTVTEPGYFHLDFTHEVFESTSRYWEIRFYDATGVNFVDGNDSYFSVKGNVNCTTNTMGVNPGTYYVHIKKSEYSGMDYRIKVNFTPASNWEVENNSSKDAANEIKVNATYNGALSTNGDVDWYRFTLSATGEVALTFNHAESDSGTRYWYIRLYDQSGSTEILSLGSKGNQPSVTGEYKTLEAGTYYVRVSKSEYWGADYSFAVQEKHDCKGSFVTTKEPTCTAAGKSEKLCDNCGKVLDSKTIPATGHTTANWSIDREPSCNVTGQRHGICDVCGTELNENIDKLPHEYGTWSYSKEPTCHESGNRSHACTVCGQTENETVPPLEHKYGDWVVTVETSCRAPGQRDRICSLCKEKESESIPRLEHTFGDWVVVSGNKLIPPIVKEKTCSVCAHVESEKDWSNIWITVLVLIAILGILIGVINYFRAFRKK